VGVKRPYVAASLAACAALAYGVATKFPEFLGLKADSLPDPAGQTTDKATQDASKSSSGGEVAHHVSGLSGQTSTTFQSATLTSAEKEATNQLTLRFNSGNFVGTVKYAEQLLADRKWDKEFIGWLTTQMPQFLTSAGWQLLKLGDCDGAKKYFQRSSTYRNLPETSKGMAYCHFREGALGDAELEVRRFLRERPLDSELALLYSDLLESDGRFDEAVAVLESNNFAATNSEAEDVAGRLAAMRARAKESREQLVTSGTHFSIRYQVGVHEEVLPLVINALEVALEDYLSNYGFTAPSQPIEVILYASERFRDAVVKGPEWAAGIFDGRIRVPLSTDFRADQKIHLEAVLRHELVHALLAERSDHRALPVWFEEGLAQRLSCPGRCPPFTYPIKLGEFLQTTYLEQPFIGLNNLAAQEAYRQSFLLVRTLDNMGDPGVNLRLVIQGINKQSDTTSDAILAPAGIRFSTLRESAERNWFRRNPMVATGGPQ
jgi:tetratricopeptide (TPR) repeat protein